MVDDRVVVGAENALRVTVGLRVQGQAVGLDAIAVQLLGRLPGVQAQVLRIALLDAEGFPIRRHWNVTYPKDKQPSVVALTFLDFLREESKLLSENYLRGIPGFPALTRGKKKKVAA